MPARPDLSSTPRFWASLYAPPRSRAVLKPLLAIEAEIRSALAPGLDHHVAHVRIAWWREECERYARGTPQHPLTRTLLERCAAAGAAEAAHTPHTPLAGLVETTAWDLAAATFETRAELEQYCEHWATAVPGLAAECASQSAAFGRGLGRSLAELELLGGLAADARRGRLRLPLDELEAHAIGHEALAHPPWPDALVGLVRARHAASRAALAASIAALAPSAQPPLRGLLVWGALAHRRSLRACLALPEPWQPRSASRLADSWLSWRAARRAEAGRLRIAPETPL